MSWAAKMASTASKLAMIALLGAAYLLLWLHTHPFAFWLAAALWGGHLGLSQAVLPAQVSACVPSSRRGEAFGTFGVVCGIGSIAGSLTAGASWPLLDGAGAFAVGVGLVVVVGLVLLIRWHPLRGSDSR